MWLELRGAVLDVNLRPYQIDVIEKCRRSFNTGKRAPLLVLGTGAGKTYCFSYMAKIAVSRGHRVLILVHRKELLEQASRSLTSLGVAHDLIARDSRGGREPIAVASVQTLDRRLQKESVSYDLIIIDEAHHAGAATWKRCLAALPKAKILGVTATPVRLDGKGLGDVFDDLIVGPSVRELMDQGYLVEPEVFAPSIKLDLSGLKLRSGDYDPLELASAMNKAMITGSAVDHYLKICPADPAIAFCASIDHARAVRDSFRKAGISSEVIHGDLSSAERSRMIDGLAAGAIQVLTSVDLISEGTDIPVVSVAILLRPTKSFGLYMQQVGRVLRPAPNKSRALILDHCGNCLMHGLPDDDREWSLNGIVRRRQSATSEGPTIRQCLSCYSVFKAAPVCPSCGDRRVRVQRIVQETEGELRRLTREAATAARLEREEAVRAKMDRYRSAKSWEELKAMGREAGDSMFFLKKRWGRKFGQQV